MKFIQKWNKKREKYLGRVFDEDTIEFYKPFEETVLSYKIIDINKVDDTPKE